MQSNRARHLRVNQGVFISGASGSGKSRMMARLAAFWKRRILVDPTFSFEAEARARKFDEAAKYLQTRWKQNAAIDLACTFKEDEEYNRLFAGIYAVATATVGESIPLCVGIDEVDLWSGPKYIAPPLSKLLRYGRHYGVSWMAACRADVQTNRDVRMNATETILFQQGMLSTEMRQMLKSAEAIRQTEMPEPFRLTRHGPNEPPEAVEGTHFLAVPEPFDVWLESWKTLARESQPALAE